MASVAPAGSPKMQGLSISICNDDCFVIDEINTMRLVEMTGRNFSDASERYVS